MPWVLTDRGLPVCMTITHDGVPGFEFAWVAESGPLMDAGEFMAVHPDSLTGRGRGPRYRTEYARRLDFTEVQELSYRLRYRAVTPPERHVYVHGSHSDQMLLWFWHFAQMTPPPEGVPIGATSDAVLLAMANPARLDLPVGPLSLASVVRNLTKEEREAMAKALLFQRQPELQSQPLINVDTMIEQGDNDDGDTI